MSRSSRFLGATLALATLLPLSAMAAPQAGAPRYRLDIVAERVQADGSVHVVSRSSGTSPLMVESKASSAVTVGLVTSVTSVSNEPTTVSYMDTKNGLDVSYIVRPGKDGAMQVESYTRFSDMPVSTHPGVGHNVVGGEAVRCRKGATCPDTAAVAQTMAMFEAIQFGRKMEMTPGRDVTYDVEDSKGPLRFVFKLTPL